MPIGKPFTLTLLALVACSNAYLCPAARGKVDENMLQAAKSVLDGNWVEDMNSTLPSPNLYPHQWSWDAAFVAMGYSHYDTQRAIDETDALFRGQWKNGLLPHIVFNPDTDESYFPGPAFWRIDTSKHAPDRASTSGIIQPPVHAIASLSIYKNAKTAEDKALALEHLRSIYPKLALWHQYLYTERDPYNEGLVFIRHMWESGMDNSPAWDAALESMKLTPDMVPEYTRVDKGKVGDHHERPSSFFYDRAVYLIKVYYENAYDEAAIVKKSPFLMQDVLFNSILARAGMALSEIANILGFSEDAKLNKERSLKTARAITSKLYDPEERFFFDYDMVAERLVKNKISGGFVALFGAAMDKNHVDAMVEHLYAPDFLGEDLSSWTIPSVSKNDPGYTNTTYWKGPAWVNINYLVRDGLLRNANGNEDAIKIADYLKDRSIEMIDSVGFYEYFNPIAGTPHGGHQFSWSAALTIDWICSSNDSPVPIPGNKSYIAYITMLFGLAVIVLAASVSSSKTQTVEESKSTEETETEAEEIPPMCEKPLRESYHLAANHIFRRARSSNVSAPSRRER